MKQNLKVGCNKRKSHIRFVQSEQSSSNSKREDRNEGASKLKERKLTQERLQRGNKDFLWKVDGERELSRQ
jgi:hypothetical protein